MFTHWKNYFISNTALVVISDNTYEEVSGRVNARKGQKEVKVCIFFGGGEGGGHGGRRSFIDRICCNFAWFCPCF